MPTEDLPVQDKTEVDAENAEDTLPVPPPSFRERLEAAQRARQMPNIIVTAKPDKPLDPKPLKDKE